VVQAGPGGLQPKVGLSQPGIDRSIMPDKNVVISSSQTCVTINCVNIAIIKLFTILGKPLSDISSDNLFMSVLSHKHLTEVRCYILLYS